MYQVKHGKSSDLKGSASKLFRPKKKKKWLQQRNTRRQKASKLKQAREFELKQFPAGLTKKERTNSGCLGRTRPIDWNLVVASARQDGTRHAMRTNRHSGEESNPRHFRV